MLAHLCERDRCSLLTGRPELKRLSERSASLPGRPAPVVVAAIFHREPFVFRGDLVHHQCGSGRISQGPNGDQPIQLYSDHRRASRRSYEPAPVGGASVRLRVPPGPDAPPSSRHWAQPRGAFRSRRGDEFVFCARIAPLDYSSPSICFLGLTVWRSPARDRPRTMSRFA